MFSRGFEFIKKFHFGSKPIVIGISRPKDGIWTNKGNPTQFIDWGFNSKPDLKVYHIKIWEFTFALARKVNY